MKVSISILTDPIPYREYFLIENLKKVFRNIRDTFAGSEKVYFRSKYRGHFAVTRSLIEGLNKNNIRDFNYNPNSLRFLSENVLVLAGVETLKQAIDLKKRGIIKKIFAGPNIVTFSSDCNNIIASEEIDLVIVNSDWTRDMYVLDNYSITNRIFVWPAGVDTEYWQSDNNKKGKQILVYNKQGTKSNLPNISDYLEILNKKGYHVLELRYGYFLHQDFLIELKKSVLLIGFTNGSESQGLAWNESWSCDVPTLILENNLNVYRGREYKCSTAPYLNPLNGLFFNSIDDFKQKFEFWENNKEKFTPRQWTIENASDEVSSLALYNKIMDLIE